MTGAEFATQHAEILSSLLNIARIEDGHIVLVHTHSRAMEMIESMIEDLTEITSPVGHIEAESDVNRQALGVTVVEGTGISQPEPERAVVHKFPDPNEPPSSDVARLAFVHSVDGQGRPFPAPLIRFGNGELMKIDPHQINDVDITYEAGQGTRLSIVATLQPGDEGF